MPRKKEIKIKTEVFEEFALPYGSPPPSSPVKREPKIEVQDQLKRLYLPLEICAFIASFSDARSLDGLQYLSMGFHSACTAEAKTRLSSIGTEPNSGLTAIKTLYCIDFKKCIRCGLKLCEGSYLLKDSPLCPCCFQGRIQITRTIAKEHFYVEDSELDTLPVTVRPNRKYGGTMSLFWLDGVRKLAFIKYGGRRPWFRIARKMEAPAPLLDEEPIPKESISFPVEMCLAIASFTKSSDLYGLRCINRNFRAAAEEEVVSRSRNEKAGLSPVVYFFRKDSQFCIRCGLPHCLEGGSDDLTSSAECPACYPRNIQITKTVAKDHFHVEDTDLALIRQTVKNSKYGRQMTLYWLDEVKIVAFSKNGGHRAWLTLAREKEALGSTWRHAHQVERRAKINRLISCKKLGVQDIVSLENSQTFKDYVLSGIPRSDADLSATVDRMVSELCRRGRKSVAGPSEIQKIRKPKRGRR